jgi:hypothetical protein
VFRSKFQASNFHHQIRPLDSSIKFPPLNSSIVFSSRILYAHPNNARNDRTTFSTSQANPIHGAGDADLAGFGLFNNFLCITSNWTRRVSVLPSITFKRSNAMSHLIDALEVINTVLAYDIPDELFSDALSAQLGLNSQEYIEVTMD